VEETQPDPVEPVGTAAPLAGARGVRMIAGEEFSFTEAIGGVRGLVESALPGLVFVVVFVATHRLTPSLIASAGLALAAVVVRLVQRTAVTQAFSGVLGVAIGVVWAWRTGEAQNFFAWGLGVNVAWCAGAAVSVLVGWPAVGVMVRHVVAHPSGGSPGTPSLRVGDLAVGGGLRPAARRAGPALPAGQQRCGVARDCQARDGRPAVRGRPVGHVVDGPWVRSRSSSFSSASRPVTNISSSWASSVSSMLGAIGRSPRMMHARTVSAGQIT
jgi:hypothetical protein